MNEADVISWLRKQNTKKLIEVFYQAFEGHHLHPLESDYLESHLILAHAKRDKSEVDARWDVELIGCPKDAADWDDDVSVGEFGDHCGFAVASWAKRFPCPVCGKNAYGT